LQVPVVQVSVLAPLADKPVASQSAFNVTAAPPAQVTTELPAASSVSVATVAPEPFLMGIPVDVALAAMDQQVVVPFFAVTEKANVVISTDVSIFTPLA
jgi:hypothetical protein